MKRQKSNTNWKMWIILLLGINCLAGIGGGVFLLAEFLKEKKVVKRQYYDYVFVAPQHVFQINNNENKSIGPVIYEANLNPNTNEAPKYWLGQIGISQLIDRIKDELGYGPEIFMLKNIIIGNENMIDDKVNGSYFPLTNQILINTNSSRQKINVNKLRATGITEQEILNIKIELIFQTLFHEYGHHISYVYLQSIKKDDSNATQDIYINKNNRKISYWNKNFVEKFKTALNYNGQQKPLLSEYKSTLWQNNKNQKVLTNFTSIGQHYSAKHLFEGANAENIYDFNLQNKKAIFSGPEMSIYIPSNFEELYEYKNNKDIAYLFSMSELFTRKYMIKNYILNLKSRWNMNERIINQNGYIKNNQFWTYTTYSYDIANYQNVWTNKNLIVKNQKYGQNYLADNPFNNKAENMYSILTKHMGQYQGSDISLIFSKNSIKFKHNEKSIEINKLQNIIDKNDEYNQIKIAGYIKEEENYISLGYRNENTNTYKKISDIDIQHYTVKSKKTKNDIEYQLLPKGEKFFYITKNYVNAIEILNKPLFFQKNDGTWVPLKTIREKEFGNSSNWFTSYSYHIGKKEYRAMKIENKIVIKEMPW